MSDMTPASEPPASVPAAPEPPASVPPPPPPAVNTAAAGGWGPPGQTRSWMTVALLTLVTCGIYGIFWQYYVFRDNKEHSGDGVGGTVGVILAIFVGIVNAFLLPHEVGAIYEKAGQERPVSAVTGFWLLLPLVGFFIWVYKIQTAINTRWEQMGVAPA